MIKSEFQLGLEKSAKDHQHILDEGVTDPWQGTVFANYKLNGNKQKGSYGEVILADMFDKMGCEVEPPLETGHDRIVEGKKLEIKFSLACTKKGQIQNDSFVMNHASVGKDWEYLLFVGVNDFRLGIEARRMILTKSKFIEIMQDENQPYFKHQQGGAKGGNDDWMCSGKNLINLIESDHVDPWENWKEVIS